ncbi:MAG: histidine kinase N-terminal 7TM domain-containing protein [Acidobacteriota bacterium]
MAPALFIALLYLTSAAISLTAAIAAYRRRESPGGLWLAGMLVAAAVWAGCDAIELQATTVEAKRLISQFQYLGVVTAAPCFFHAAMELAGQRRRLTRWVRLAVWGIPMAALVAAWTSAWHSWIWTRIDLPQADSPFALYHYGAFFWVLAAQHYVLTLAGSWVLLASLRYVDPHFKVPLVGVVASIGLAWLGNFLYIFKFGPWPGLNWLTMSLGMSGAVLTWVVLREGLLDLLPRAREALVRTMRDGVVVFDRGRRITFANPAGREVLGLSVEAPVLMERAVFDDGTDGRVPRELELSLEGPGGTRWFDLRVSAVIDRWREVAGRLVVIRDITARRALERERERLIAELTAALTSVRELEQLLPICASCHKVRDDQGYWSQLEEYLRIRGSVEFTHAICPSCMEKLYGNVDGEASETG